MSVWKTLRIAVLLTVLVVVAGTQWLKESHLADWNSSIWVTVYPVIADGTESTENYTASLDANRFREIGSFITREARRYGLSIDQPLIVQLAEPIFELPPPIPAGNNPLSVGVWSLKMRWWAWRRAAADDLIAPDVQIFVLYRDNDNQPLMDRSVGLRKGMYAIVNAFASRGASARNKVVMTHELLHLLGASDKYDPMTNLPVHPEGFAQPGRQPLFPQSQAEIMGGRVALAPGRARMPASLEQCVIGSATAEEIGW